MSNNTKSDLLTTAELLFSQRGYDNTSTNDIVKTLGIARGTLYHYFKSKEDILDSLVIKYAQMLITNAKNKSKETSTLQAPQRIIEVIRALKPKGIAFNELMKQIHKPENALIHYKMEKVTVNGVLPILTEIIIKGAKDGLFSTPYPDEATEMIYFYSQAVFDEGKIPLNINNLETKINGFIFNIEKLLGTKRGELNCLKTLFMGT